MKHGWLDEKSGRHLRADHHSCFWARTASIALNPIYRGAFERIRSSGQMPLVVKNVDRIVKLYETNRSKDLAKVRDEFLELANQIPGQQRAEFLKKLHMNIIDIIREQFKKEMKNVNLPYLNSFEDAKAVGVNLGGSFERGSLAAHIIVDKRNEYMATEIAKRICSGNVTNGKIVVLVGKNHIPGVYEILQKLFKDRLRAYRFDTDSPEEVPELLKAIK